MNLGSDRYSRRSRTRTTPQSSEMVGLLPAEEIALKRALMASLANSTRTKAKDRVITVTDDSDEEKDPLPNTPGSKGVTKASSNDGEHRRDRVGCARTSEKGPSPLIRLPLKRLASPSFSDEDSTSSNLGHASSSTSMAPSPLPSTKRSPPAMRLYLSSSSSPSSSLSDSFSPEWHPKETKTTSSGKRAGINKKNQKKKLSAGKQPVSKRLRVSNVEVEDAPSPKKMKKVLPGDDEENISESVEDIILLNDDSWRESVCVMEKEEREGRARREQQGGYQAHRKFASTHTPTIKYRHDSRSYQHHSQHQPALHHQTPYLPREKVKECKQLPKTEDFISYLCLRGSGDIPKHLQKFESPWTPRSRKTKGAKKTKGRKSKDISGTTKKISNTNSGL